MALLVVVLAVVTTVLVSWVMRHVEIFLYGRVIGQRVYEEEGEEEEEDSINWK